MMAIPSAANMVLSEIAPACSESMQIDDVQISSETCFLSQLQTNLAQVVLKHRELSLIPKSTTASLIKDIQNVIQLSQLAFGQSISHALSANEMQSGCVEQIVGDLLEQHEMTCFKLYLVLKSSSLTAVIMSIWLCLAKNDWVLYSAMASGFNNRTNMSQSSIH